MQFILFKGALFSTGLFRTSYKILIDVMVQVSSAFSVLPQTMRESSKPIPYKIRYTCAAVTKFGKDIVQPSCIY